MHRSEQRKPFQPPTKDQYLRFTTTIDLVTPTDASPRETAHTHKSVVHVPVSRLPLSDDAAIHRFKLLAGPRWIPPKNAILQQEGGEVVAEEEHGWFKMSQDSFGEVRLNRQWLMDTMQRLVQEANVSLGGPSPLSSVLTALRSQQRPPSRNRSCRSISATYTLVCARSGTASVGTMSGQECRLEPRQETEVACRDSPMNGCSGMYYRSMV
jgi:hypothetical protein